MTANEPNATNLFKAAVGDRIREWREALQIRQDVLAERSGLSVRQVRRIEAGEANPNVTTLQALAKVFEAEPYGLVDVGGGSELPLRFATLELTLCGESWKAVSNPDSFWITQEGRP